MPAVSVIAHPNLSYDCPTCGIHFEGDLLVSVSFDPVRIYPKNEIAPGVFVDDLRATPRLVAVNRRFSTVACGCVFAISDDQGRPLNMWSVEVAPPGDGKTDRLVITRIVDGDGLAAAA